jgi:AbrB family looped-hinge helix DNA binding protein
MKPVFLTVSSKGQVVIPAAFREELGIGQGTRIAARLEGGRLILDPVNLAAKLRLIDELLGSTAGGPSGTDLLLEERRQEREREQHEEGW